MRWSFTEYERHRASIVFNIENLEKGTTEMMWKSVSSKQKEGIERRVSSRKSHPTGNRVVDEHG